MLRYKRKSKLPYARRNAHPTLRALNPAITAIQTQADRSRPTQAAAQLASSLPQKHQLPVDDPTTNEQTVAPLPTIAPSIPLTASGKNPFGVHVPQAIICQKLSIQ